MGGNDLRVVTAHVHPHDHQYSEGGPIDIRIGQTFQPRLVREWDWVDKKHRPFYSLDQPDETSNFTLVRLLFIRGETERLLETFGQVWHRATSCRALRGNAIELRIRARIVQTLPHPIPIGQWVGSVAEDSNGKWVLYVLQHRTLAVAPKAPEKRTIIFPRSEEPRVASPDSQIIIP